MENTAARMEKDIEMLSKISAPGPGVTRLPFTPEAKKTVEALKWLMAEAGMEVRVDASEAVIGRLEGKRKETILIGSHYDSVKNGGAFDGMSGVICGIEMVRQLGEAGIQPEYSVEVIAMNDEEGARFSSGFLSSKALLGEITVDELKRLKDAAGISIYEAMEAYGADPGRIVEAARDIRELKAFLEVHIEQGPILEANQKSIGIVDTIVGMKRRIITVKGRADHVGTTPMDMRIDAIEIAAKAVARLGDLAREYEHTVATCGYFAPLPNAVNTVASEVKFSVDIRSTKLENVDAVYHRFLAILDEEAARFKGSYSVLETLTVDPVDMDGQLQNLIEDSCIQNGFAYQHINSGAGHDSLPIGEKMPTAMIFVPSKKGRSHCPEEDTDCKYLAQAVAILKDVVLNLK